MAWRQAIIWTNAAILLVGPLGTNFSGILMEIHAFSLKKNAFENVVWKMAAILSRPQCIKENAFRMGHIAQQPWLGLLSLYSVFNTLKPRQNGHHFADDTFNRIFLNENVRISIKISLKFVPMGPINNIPALVQIMAWRRPGDKPLSEPVMVNLLTHICVTRPQWSPCNSFEDHALLDEIYGCPILT